MTASHEPHPCIVVGFDGSPASHVALSRAIQRVGPGGKLYLVHAWDVPESWRGRASPVARSISDVARVRHADDVVVGTRGFGRVRALLGSVAHELIHLADCPVTIIPERMVERTATEEATEPAATPA